MKVVCDYSKCTGCLACVVTCMDHHYPSEVHDAVSPRLYSKTVQPSGYTHYVTRSCCNCPDAPCMAHCPHSAISRQSSGWTVVDSVKCIGCRLCLKVCPFDIPQFSNQNIMVKCDGCGGQTKCIKVCPNGALSLEE